MTEGNVDFYTVISHFFIRIFTSEASNNLTVRDNLFQQKKMPRTNEQNQEYEVKSILNHASYRNVESCKRDILAALHHYRGLQPKSQKYTFNDGRSRDLICLEGTIPVPYRGASYNIPVSIFVLDTHPNHAPICYVRPTAEMRK